MTRILVLHRSINFHRARYKTRRCPSPSVRASVALRSAWRLRERAHSECGGSLGLGPRWIARILLWPNKDCLPGRLGCCLPRVLPVAEFVERRIRGMAAVLGKRDIACRGGFDRETVPAQVTSTLVTSPTCWPETRHISRDEVCIPNDERDLRI